MEQGKRPKPTHVGLRDFVGDGWWNMATGEITQGVKIRSTDTIIDVGCGDGGHSYFCARQGAEVIFIDMDAAKLAGTEAKIKASPAHAFRAILSDCSPIPLPDATGDIIICTEVLEHVADPRVFLQESIRVAKPGARLVITVPDARSEQLVGATAPEAYFQEPNHIRIFAEGELRALLLAAGLEIQSEQKHGSYWSMYMALSWLTSGTDEMPIDNPHAIPDHWVRLWKALQDHPNGHLVRESLNELLPRTQSIVARKGC
jgi:ubiquinone/menaquinone biosynthesis C-methylase UbiE